MTYALLAMAGNPQAQAGGQSQGNLLMSFAPLLAIFVIFYFLLIRPQQKQQKKMAQMLSSVRKGDQIVTRGGIHGKVVGSADSILTVEIAQNVQVKMNRDAVVHVTPSAE